MSEPRQQDVLVLGTSTGELYMPDAVTDFDSSLSAESDVRCVVVGKTYAPASTDGEVIFRRILLTGYQQASVALWVTPILHGRYIHELRTYVQSPAPASGKMEKFEFLVPLAKIHPDFPDHPYGLRGSSINCYIETVDPADEFHLETVTYAYELINTQRGRRPGEAEKS